MTTKERVAFCTNIQKKHGQKIIFAIFALFISLYFGAISISFFILFVASFPGIGTLLAVLMVFFVYVGIFALHTGFCLILLKIIRDEYTILGDLFVPFKNFKRTINISTPFALSAFASSFASALVILSIGSFESIFSDVANIQNNTTFIVIIYIFLFITLLFNIPFVYLPFFGFDMQKKSPKEIKKISLILFKQSFKELFSGYIAFAGKQIVFFLIILILSFLNIKVISNLASVISSFFLFFVYTSIMLMTARIYQDFVQPEPKVEISSIEKIENTQE